MSGEWIAALKLARRRLNTLLIAVATLVTLQNARAQEPVVSDRYRISVLTFGPGDHPFLKFGHNALLVEDQLEGRENVYNFGTFEFDSPTLIPDFLKGRLRYSLSVSPLRSTLRVYKSANRSIYVQELRLSPGLEDKFVQALELNALPENKYYKYDYYLDNCSTRVRDAIDVLLEGRLHAAATGAASMTWRGHTLRLTADDLPVYMGLNIAMGAFIDRPITRWEEMFIPEKLQQTLRDVSVQTTEGDQPLVKSEHVLFEAVRAPVRSEAPRWTVMLLLAGVGCGGFLLGLAELGTRQKAARAAYFTLLSVLGLVLGLLGVIFAFFWFGTDHRVAYANENLLQCPPFALLLVVSAPLAAFGRPGAVRLTWRTLLACLTASLLGLLFKGLPWFHQGNGQIIALLFPLWLGVTLGAWRLGLRTAALSADGA